MPKKLLLKYKWSSIICGLISGLALLQLIQSDEMYNRECIKHSLSQGKAFCKLNCSVSIIYHCMHTWITCNRNIFLFFSHRLTKLVMSCDFVRTITSISEVCVYEELTQHQTPCIQSFFVAIIPSLNKWSPRSCWSDGKYHRIIYISISVFL